MPSWKRYHMTKYVHLFSWWGSLLKLYTQGLWRRTNLWLLYRVEISQSLVRKIVHRQVGIRQSLLSCAESELAATSVERMGYQEFLSDRTWVMQYGATSGSPGMKTEYSTTASASVVFASASYPTDRCSMKPSLSIFTEIRQVFTPPLAAQ